MSSEPALIAKSNIIMEVKPWDDETDMKKLEECVRSISCDGLVWGACKFTRTVDALVVLVRLTYGCVGYVSLGWLRF